MKRQTDKQKAFTKWWNLWVAAPFWRCQYVFDKDEMRSAWDSGYKAGRRSKRK